MAESNGGESSERDSDNTSAVGSNVSGDTFGVGIHVTDAEFQFVVHVPSDIGSGWADPEAFQRLVEQVVWNRLDRTATLRGIDGRAAVGDTVMLGRVTLQPDGTVVDSEFDAGVVES